MPDFRNEYEFQHAIESLASEYGWEARHIPAGAYRAAKNANTPIPAGIPDLELRFYETEENNPIIMFAELKMYDPNESKLEYQQEKFLKGFAHIVPCFLWRPQNWDWIKNILKCGPPAPTGEIIEETTSPSLVVDTLIRDGSTRAKVHRILSEIGSANFPSGDLAGLRRMNPDAPNSTAFLRVMAQAGYPEDSSEEVKWALILHGIALMSPNPHDKGTPIGEALFFGGDSNRQADRGFYNEIRLNRLLNAGGTTLRSLLSRMFRMLANTNQPFDWYEMASFILEENQGEQARIDIARAYYQAQYRSV